MPNLRCDTGPQRSLFKFAVIPLQQCSRDRSAWTLEHEIIAQWQAHLNFPRATQDVRKTSLTPRVKESRLSSFCYFGLRLWHNLKSGCTLTRAVFRMILAHALEHHVKQPSSSVPALWLMRKLMPSSCSTGMLSSRPDPKSPGCSS